MQKLAIALLSLAVILGLETGQAKADLIVNGGFEPDLSSWTVLDQAGGSGSWFSQSGTGSPLNSFLVPAPPELLHAAMTDQTGPGSHLLYQDFVVPFGVTSATLSYQLYLNNQNGAFITPDDLHYDGGPNQQARVDIITTAADPFTVAVLQNSYQTMVGDPAESGYILITTDLTALLAAHGGETLRLRFAEVDNQLFFAMGVDDVHLDIQQVAAVPEPGTLALAGMGIFGLAGYVRRRRAKVAV